MLGADDDSVCPDALKTPQSKVTLIIPSEAASLRRRTMDVPAQGREAALISIPRA